MVFDSSAPRPLITDTKGVIHGNAFQFDPRPPDSDISKEPVVVALIPERVRAVVRSQRSLLQIITFRKDHKAESLRKVQASVDAIIADTVARIRPLLPNQSSKRFIYHPYDLKDAFDFLPEIPRELAVDRRYLEKLLFYTLFIYKTVMERQGSGKILFIRDAKEYFSKGYRLEQQLPSVGSLPDAKLELCQQIYDQYYHGSRAYICALLAGEELEQPNQYFMYFCNARYFLARVDWDGVLLERPLGKKLPTRDEMLYFAMRDPTVVRQYSTVPEYTQQLMTILRAFPSDMKTAHVVAKVRHEAKVKASAAPAQARGAEAAPAASADAPHKKHFRAARLKKPPR